MTSTSVEQLEKLVGQEYAVEPVSTHCPPINRRPHRLIPQLRSPGTSETFSHMPLELAQIHPRSNSYMVCYVLLIPPKSSLTFPFTSELGTS